MRASTTSVMTISTKIVVVDDPFVPRSAYDATPSINTTTNTTVSWKSISLYSG